jgi:histidinol-phosphate aminotransferase
MYGIAVLGANGVCRITPHTEALGHDPEAMAEAAGPLVRLIFIANPNNPTGTYLPRAALERLLDRVPAGVLTVLDEAYFEYVEAPDYPDGAALLARYPDLVVLRTFSKIHALAGLRIGYALAAPPVAALLERVRSPFNTSSIAQTAALAALDDPEHVRLSREANRDERDRLAAGLRSLGVRFSPSVANFLLVHLGSAAEAGEIYQRMLRAGVIVRPMAGFGFPEALRVSVGLPGETARCLEALRGALGGALGGAPAARPNHSD